MVNANARTHEQGKGFSRAAESELYLRATTMFSGQDSFYEKAGNSDQRAIKLGKELAVSNWGWYAPFLVWLRSEGNIRTMSAVLAVEGVRARLNSKMDPDLIRQVNDAAGFTNRKVIERVLQRPDEPGKMLGYHFTNYGKNVPQPIKRGIADALVRMMNQRQALRYDKPGETVRPGDVIDFLHPDPEDGKQSAVFRHLITSRHDREGYEPPAELDEIHARWELMKFTPDQRHEFGAKIIAGDTDAAALFRKALAGSWEWGKLWLGEK